MTGKFFLSSLGNTAGQTAANTALNSASSGMLSNLMSTGLPAMNTGFLSGLSGLGSKAWDFLGNQQTANAVGAGANMFNAFNQFNQGKDYSRILKSQENRAADAYARDKEAAAKRQLLTF